MWQEDWGWSGILRALQKERSNETQSYARRLQLSQSRTVLGLDSGRGNSLPGAATQSMERIPAPAPASSVLWGYPPTPKYRCIGVHPKQFSQLLWWYLGQTTFAEHRVRPQSTHQRVTLTAAGTAYLRGNGLHVLTQKTDSSSATDHHEYGAGLGFVSALREEYQWHN